MEYTPAIVLPSTISVVEQDDRVGKAAIGYCIGRPWWRQGYTSEALSRIIDFLIAGVGVNRVESWHDPNNPPGTHSAASAGTW